MEITVNGVRLFYEQTGSGRPLIMVHGNSEDHTIFDEAVEVLKDRFTCYAIDSRSHGSSETVPELHYEDMADDVVALIEALDLQHVVYYGFSDGGIIGLYAAVKCDRIEEMIISGTNITPQGVAAPMRYLIRTINFLHKDPKMKLMLEEPNIDPAMLHQIKARTLVLAGARDVVREEETLKIGANIPHATVRILPGEGHGSYIVHKTKIAELIAEFTSGGRQ